MRARADFTAALVHTSGPERGTREQVRMPLLGARPPEVLRRPVNLAGSPSYEEWTLESLDEWIGETPVAIYRLTGHSRRDPNARPDLASGRVLPWRE